jgi:ribosomal protein L7/L12
MTISQTIREQIRQGEIIGAIKSLREETGMSLQDAKNAVDALASGKEWPLQPSARENTPLSSAVLDQLLAGQKIEAIKLLRNETGIGLKDAKDAVERVILARPELKERIDEINRQALKKFGTALALIAAVILLIIYYVQ